MTRVIGIDAAGRHGWVAVTLDDDEFAGAIVGGLDEIMAGSDEEAVVGIDIPIGNLPDRPRGADAAARRLLPGRTSTVFSAPPTEVLDCASYREANERCEAMGRPKLSAQSWGIVPKIREARAWASDPRVIEVHPEVSFTTMAGGEALPSKKNWNGLWRRVELLEAHGIVLPRDHAAGGVVADDLLDAAAAWTAARHARGEALALPEQIEVDESGRRIAIWV